MRITSEDRHRFLEIIINDPDDPYSDYAFRAVVKGDINPFSGQNDRVQFSDLDTFLKRFAEFIRTREGVAILDMTEDCRLEFFRWNARGDVGVRAQITEYGFSTDSERMNKASIDIEFKVDGEFINQIYEELVRMKGA